MTDDTGEVVRVASGTLVQVELWQGALKGAGIKSKVVGTDLSGGFGSTLAGSVELWVDEMDAPRAAEVLQAFENERGNLPVPDVGK